jgi:hypothetical protein
MELAIQQNSEICHFLSFCPECKEPKPISANRIQITRGLEAQADVHVMSICGHIWSVAGHEKESLRNALHEGSI